VDHRTSRNDVGVTDMTGRIYVQIPAYRDTELLPTVQDLMRTAEKPDRLRVAIAWQHDDGEVRLENAIRACGNVELHKVRAAESQGCNWARSLLQHQWDGEQYTLFLDSHHRFIPGWDEQAIRLHEERRRAGVAKPIITGYLPPYDSQLDPHGRTVTVFKMCVLERHQGMLFRLVGHPIPRWAQLTEPVPAHFASLHFLFADGFFNEEIAFDPAVYFFADEIAIALRAYTLGYDLFHPHCILGWHLYDRTTRRTHWADHTTWAARNDASCRRLRELFSGALHGRYGVGAERNVSDYEEFIGLPLITEASEVRA
jgi:hypothetical protein